MQSHTIATTRVKLVSAAPGLLEAERAGNRALERALEAVVPDGWPPPLYGERTLDFAADFYRRNPQGAGWMLWYVLRAVLPGAVAAGESRPTAVGVCGFKGLPDEDGTVEIGYSVLPGHQRKGYASEAVAALVEWAFAHDEVRRVIAETFPDLGASVRVLERNGFAPVGAEGAEGIIRYEITRALHERIVESGA
jgi:RimJ/RimL family protein N-acetyltransferase